MLTLKKNFNFNGQHIQTKSSIAKSCHTLSFTWTTFKIIYIYPEIKNGCCFNARYIDNIFIL